MNTSDFAGMAFWGVIAGVFAFVVFDQNLKQPYRTKVVQWCLAVGGCAILYFASFSLFNEKTILTKSTLGLGFVGLPSLVCGLLLIARDCIRREK